jgi:poly(3-hydroxybutyrate) depolymerase/lysophospholipase L1-like esterase
MRLRLLFLGLVGFAFAVRGDDFEARTFAAADGGKLPYRLLTPANIEPGKKYPLVLFFHGAGERGVDNALQLKHGAPVFAKAENREKFPCFVFAPQCPRDKKWVDMDWGATSGTAPVNASPLQSMALAAVDALSGEFPIDPDRIYVTGLSMGGYMTWDLITRDPGRFAAAIAVCGGGDSAKAAAAKSIPVWAFCGLADNVVPPVRTQDMVASLRTAGGKAALTEYPGVAHDSWTYAYSEPNLLPWLFSQVRGEPAQKMELAVSQFTALAMPPENVFPGAGPVQVAPWFQKLWMARRVNRGINGDTSRGVRYRLREDVLDLHPRTVSLLIGTNDLQLGGTPEQVVENLRAIVAELEKQNRNVRIILNLVMPRGPVPGKFPENIRKLNGRIQEFAKKTGRVVVCDSWSIFDDGNGSCKKEEFPDMLHPNKAAYAKWKAALDEVFAKLKP